MKITSAEFLVSATDLKSCPKLQRPEFALIGRSNVGKSSLINLISAKGDLARVSVTPGKTRLINFFLMNNNWCLVDLPGYGFAKGPKEERADFNEAVADYIEGRPSLRCVFVLIDANIEPKRLDLDFINWMTTCEVPFALIFTKTDKHPAGVGKSVATYKKTLAEHGLTCPDTLTCSSKSKQGRTEILNYISKHMDKPAAKK